MRRTEEILGEENMESRKVEDIEAGKESPKYEDTEAGKENPKHEEIAEDRGRYLAGSGVIEMILIMVVLIAIVILFKGQITALAELIFGDIFTKAGSVF